MGEIRRDDEASGMPLRGNFVLPMQSFDLRDVRDLEAQRRERHPLAC